MSTYAEILERNCDGVWKKLNVCLFIFSENRWGSGEMAGSGKSCIDSDVILEGYWVEPQWILVMSVCMKSIECWNWEWGYFNVRRTFMVNFLFIIVKTKTVKCAKIKIWKKKIQTTFYY